jgi:hypothetical protein
VVPERFLFELVGGDPEPSGGVAAKHAPLAGHQSARQNRCQVENSAGSWAVRMTSRRWLGSLLLISTLLLGVAGYFMYQSGSPGAPKLQQDIRFTVGPQVFSDDPAVIRVLAPPNVTVSTHTRFIIRGHATSSGEAQLTLTVTGPGPDVYLVLQLVGGAVSTDVQPVEDIITRKASAHIIRVIDKPATGQALEYRKFYDLQLVIIRLSRDALGRTPDGRILARSALIIHMRDPAIARENARYVFAMPKMLRPRACQELGGISRDEETVRIDENFPEQGGCRDYSDDSPDRQTVTLDMPTDYFRVDHASPQLSDPGHLVWTWRNNIRVKASLVSIDDEARGQQLLFFSGIAAGLASGLLPLALELMMARGAMVSREELVERVVS